MKEENRENWLTQVHLGEVVVCHMCCSSYMVSSGEAMEEEFKNFGVATMAHLP